ncbi:MAG: adenylate/guanylate cyclase domain-containing protein [Chthoniobacterales bacterium]
MISPFALARLRSGSGLIIGLYVTLHLLNHALGLISIGAQEAARPWVMAFWHSPPGQVLLYGALSVHAVCALLALARRRHHRMPAWEATQLVIGLAIPYLLLVHIVNTRGTRILTGIDIDYTYEIANLWVVPWNRFCQIALVLLVWIHFAVGLHFWLRLGAWYRRIFPALLLAYVLVPIGALLGFAEVGMTMSAHARSDPRWFQELKTRGVPADAQRAALRAQLKERVGPAWLALVGLVFVGAQIRNWRRRHSYFSMTYPDGHSVKAPIGLTVLEVSRRARRAHVSVCGGRARCTTCRVRIDQGADRLLPPNDLEARALARIGAPESVRLACQLRPESDLTIRPLLHPDLVIRQSKTRAKEFGEERKVTILFIDLRGSTRLAEARLPYDVVFLLNHYFAEMAAAVEASGGHYSNFTGDGLMALFGLKASDDFGAHAALRCAEQMLAKLDRLNLQLAPELSEPLAMGIGIHTGEAIIGRMGPPRAPVLTALGDAVNMAARLESATKELAAPVVVSRATLEAAQLTAVNFYREILLRGRSGSIVIAPLDHQDLHSLLASDPVAA